MSRFTYRFSVAFISLFLLLDQPVASAPVLRNTTAVQASVSASGLAIVSSPGMAKVIDGPRGVRRLKIRRTEHLSAVEELSGGLIAAGVRRYDDRSQLVFIEANRRGSERLPAPPRLEAVRVRPVLLVTGGELHAAAWLEGPDVGSLRVRTADWLGDSWGPIITVSSVSAGSQTGLTGAILPDGSRLLVWSQFDGTDDDLHYAWMEDDEWSIPSRIGTNNHLPDITPALTAGNRGALLAWSSFDGASYRVKTSTFERGSWGKQRPVGGPGSLYPQLLRRDGKLFLVSQESAPRGWTVAEADARGRLVKRSFVATASTSRPILSDSSAAAVTLFWPQSDERATVHLEVLP